MSIGGAAPAINWNLGEPAASLGTMDPPTLTISLLGGFDLRYGSEAVPISSARIRSLLAWLALRADHPQPRVRVASALWPDSHEGQARTNLRNLLHQLRRAFPEIELYLDLDRGDLVWRPGAPLSIDVVKLDRALTEAQERGGAAERGAALEAVLTTCDAPLLPEVYESWLAPEQERVRRRQMSGLETLLEAYVERADFARTRDVSERILRLDPLSESAHRARITALAALGDGAGAARAFRQCASVLASELGVDPSPATIEARRATVRLSSQSTPHAAAGATLNNSLGTDEVRMVGRDREAEALRNVWNRAQAEGTRAVWVTGEAGIGKSRLVQAFTEWIERHGGRTVQARAYPTLGALAYGPVIAWLRSPVLEPVVADMAATTRSALGWLLSELDGTSTPVAEELTEGERRQRLHDAVIAVLSRAEGPLALIIDDLQWSDRETIDLLNSVVARTTRPLLIVAAVRSGEMSPEDALPRVEAALDAAGRLERIELNRLGLEETGILARELLGEGITDEDVLALFRETEGNPLFIVETARIGRTWGASDDAGRTGDSLSPRIRAVIEARLSRLSSDARLVTRVASTIGREFTLPLLLNVSPLAEDATLRGLEEAWRRKLVRERGDSAYDFSHGKIREVAYRTTNPIRRRTYHQRIAEVLERSLAAGGAGSDATLDQIALHYDRGGSVAEAVEWYRRAARAAMDVSGLDPVRQLLARALELVERLPRGRAREEMELEMWLAYGSVLVALEGYGRPRVIESYERARDLCERLGRPVTPPILRALALASLAGGDLEAGTRFGIELSTAAERDADPVAAVEGAYVSGVMAFWKGELEEAERRLTEAIAQYRPDRHRDHVLLYAQDPKVACLSRLAWTLWHRGRPADALFLRDEALALAARQSNPLGLAYALWFTLFIPIEQGDVQRLVSQTEELKRIASQHRLLYADTVADGLLGYVEAARGNARRGIARMRATLEDCRWLGMEYVLKGQTLYLIAKAAASAGDHRTAKAVVAEALEYLGPGPSIWKAPLRQIEARLTAGDDRTGDRALPAFRAALEVARATGSAWTELGVAIDRGRWTLEHRDIGRQEARVDLERALVTFAGARPMPAVAAGRIVLERITREGDS